MKQISAYTSGRSLLFSLAFWLVAGFAGMAHVGPALALNISPTSVTIPVGGKATVTLSEARGNITVSSSAPSVATVAYVSGNAIITAVAVGSATVTVRATGDSKQVRVTVTPPLSVSPSAVSVPAGGNATVSVSNATGAVSATSANAAIATVTYASGTASIHGVAAGTAVVTISDSYNSRSVAVTVTPPLSVSPSTVSVLAGGNATVSVSNATGAVSATSANTAIATVTYASGTATIHGVAAGSTVVTISDSLSSRNVSVTVTAPLSVTPAAVSVQVGSNATVSVSNATGTVRATSANTAIATVSYASGTASIHGVAAGATVVTISDNLSSRSVAVTVTAASSLTVTPTSVSLPVGGTAAISVSNATGSVTASSSSTAIATVSYAAGVATIRGIAVGNATITIRDSLNSRNVAATVVAATAGNFTLLAWNNLGMHCFDGIDYSIFSILPPLNTMFAQLKDKSGALVTNGVTLTYQATADTTGSINSISSTKTNFWRYAQSLFGLSPAPDVGLLGYPMASGTPAPMAFNATHNWFEAVGIPITNHDDTNRINEYPMVLVQAKNSGGQVLASTKVVLPVSDQLDCQACHTSNNGSNAAANAARPAAGWVFDPDPLKDWKRNILRLHDEKQATNVAFINALQRSGYTTGLLNSATIGKPVLCAACHVSNAYQVEAGVATGLPGITPLTAALHTLHGKQIDPVSGLALDDTNNRNTCYMCHPGSTTQCLRGAMSGPQYQCQSCHGKMSKVGEVTRIGWLSEPTCQSCHNNGRRLISSVDANGNPLSTADQTFATTADQPSAGFNLYRFSTGHGGVKCEACHGSTHAEFPTTQANDNVQSIAVQGHAGTVRECSACHVASLATTARGGPHGMHSIGTQWVSQHHDLIGSGGGTQSCAYCHGADFRGSALSAVKVAKSFNVEGRSVTYAEGQQVSCYDCHNGPTSAAVTGQTMLATKQDAGLGQLISGVWTYLASLGRQAMSGVLLATGRS